MENDVLTSVIEKHAAFCEATFPEGTSLGALKHLKREIEEVEADINSGAPREKKLEEGVDCLGCLLDFFRREGFNHYDITNALYSKLQVNMGREWIYNGDGSYSHVK